MNVISEGGLVATALMIMLLGFWVIVATTSRYLYVFSMKYDLIDFNLNN